MIRQVLPNRRPSEKFDLYHWSRKFIVDVGFNQSHEILEVFINTGKSGEHMQILLRDSAIIFSLALQWGVPVEDMRRAITREADRSPSGPIGRLLDELHAGH